ncbi:MAG TPA: VanW family protein [Acidimicrobiia bacterium]|nr:VanW family protein [Acidimicrobiia bacterium]
MPTNQRSQKAVLLFGALGVLLLVAAIYGIVRWGGQGRVLGSVTVLDVELGGMTREGATEALGELEERLASMPAVVVVEGVEADILPTQTGFELHEASIVDEAMQVGRSDNPVSDFFWWIGHLAGSTPVPPRGTVDSQAVDQVLDGLDTEIIGEPPFQGGVELVDREPVARYPRSGRRIDRAAAEPALLDSFLALGRRPVELVVREERPQLTDADVDAAVAEAQLMLSAPVVLAAEDGTTLTFTVAELQDAFVAVTHDDPAGIELGFDVDVIEARLDEVRPEFESAPVDARFEISGYEVSILEGRNGTLLDAEQTAEVLAGASRTSSRQAELPLEEGAEPETTTEDLEALDIRHLVSQFTTYHDCCAPRVTNIHLIADEVDGAIVPPGATFSLNEHVGRRTEDEGYLPDGTIIGGEIVDTVGGGVSQFATTFYNAVFWGGYEDIDHKPHSFYFDRYPEGIEATISWPLPDVVFRNNDDSGILIKTEYTDTSITVKFYGNNEGRILAGEQSGGQMGVGVVAEGGPGAKEVRGDRSERFDFREPPEPLYRPAEDLEVNESRTIQRPREGWSLTVTRTITVDGEETTEEWPVRYLAQQEIIEVHPCKVPDSGEACPTTTTTTTAPTTTVPESTTSTAPPTTVPPTTSTTEPA